MGLGRNAPPVAHPTDVGGVDAMQAGLPLLRVHPCASPAVTELAASSH